VLAGGDRHKDFAEVGERHLQAGTKLVGILDLAVDMAEQRKYVVAGVAFADCADQIEDLFLGHLDFAQGSVSSCRGRRSTPGGQGAGEKGTADGNNDEYSGQSVHGHRFLVRQYRQASEASTTGVPQRLMGNLSFERGAGGVWV